MQINEKIIEEIKLRADIVEIISQHVDLKAAGRNHMGLCPFHQEKTPSFNVSRDKQFFKCFGCQVSGDVIAFIMKYEGLNFVESIKKLAAIYGVTIEDDQKLSPQQKRNNLYYSINKEAADWFHSNLLQEANSRYSDYLTGRGINSESIHNFLLGFAPDNWSALALHLKTKGFSEQVLNECGLVSFTKRDNKAIDRFRSRIIFPVFNSSGNISGFSGRIVYKDDEPAKYLNTPETSVFKKSQLLYGMFQARKHIHDKRRALIVEGHLDVIAMHQNGYMETVGVQGTSFTSEHASWLKKYADELIIIYDADQAGVKAAIRMLPILLKCSLSAKVVSLPPKEDPASILSNNDSTIIESYIEKAIPLLDFKITYMKQSADTPEKMRSLLMETMNDINEVTSPVLRDRLLQSIAHSLNLRINSVMEEWDKFKKPSFRKNLNNKFDTYSANNSLLTRAEEELLVLIFSDPKLCQELFERLQFLWIEGKTSYPIFEKILKCFCEKSFSSETFDYCLSDLPQKMTILEHAEKLPSTSNSVKNLHQVIDNIEKEYLRKESKGLMNQLRSAPDENQVKIMKKIDLNTKRIREITPDPLRNTLQDQ